MKIMSEEIMGVWFGDEQNAELVCRDCMTQEDWKDLKTDQLLTPDDVRKAIDNEEYYACERCHKLFM